MSTINKQQISDALREAMNRENLHTRETAQKLNLNPCYISMSQNPKSWDSMGKTAWLRLEDWHVTRGPIGEFVIPEGEEIWKPKEKAESKDIAKGPSASLRGTSSASLRGTSSTSLRGTTSTTLRGASEKREVKKKNVYLIKPSKKHSEKQVFTNVTEKEEELLKEIDRLIEKNAKQPEFTRIPIALDLQINITVSLFGNPVSR